MRPFYIVVLCAGATIASGARVALAAPAIPLQQAQSDAADAVYGRARRALDERNYDAAAKLFNSIITQYPKSVYAPDALYWKGFAHYRAGNLDSAKAALETQAERFPNATTRADAAPLLIVVKGELAKRGNAAARRDVDSAASTTSGACSNTEVQSAALDALQQMDPDRVLPLLRKVMARRDECSAPLRKNALFILAQKGGDERDKLLLDIAKSDPSTPVRNDAVFYLGQSKGDAAVDALEDILLHSDESGVRGNALFALAQIHTDRASKILQQFATLDGAPTPLRKDALFQVAQQHSPDTYKWMASLVTNAKAPMELRKDAVFHLSQQKPDASDELTNVYDSPLPFDVKKDLIFYFAQRKDDKSLLKLIAIAKTDANQELRKEALFHLAQSKDPRALKALEELVSP